MSDKPAHTEMIGDVAPDVVSTQHRASEPNSPSLHALLGATNSMAGVMGNQPKGDQRTVTQVVTAEGYQPIGIGECGLYMVNASPYKGVLSFRNPVAQRWSE